MVMFEIWLGGGGTVLAWGENAPLHPSGYATDMVIMMKLFIWTMLARSFFAYCVPYFCYKRDISLNVNPFIVFLFSSKIMT